MGLDQYIYREKKDSFNKRKELTELILKLDGDFYNEHKDEIDENGSKVYELYKKNVNGEYDNEIQELTSAFHIKYKDYYDKRKKLKDERNYYARDYEELMYWRKFWAFHEYLNRVLGFVENCEDSVISKDQFKTIIKDIKKVLNTKDLTILGQVSEYDLNDIWGELENTKEVFEKILDSYDDDYVYYYRPWW